MLGNAFWTNDRKPPKWATEMLRALWPDRRLVWNNQALQWEIAKGYLPKGSCSLKYARVGIFVDDDGLAVRDLKPRHFIPFRRNRYLELHPEFRLKELVEMEKAEKKAEDEVKAKERERGQAYWQEHHIDYMKIRGTNHLRNRKVAFQGAGST